MVNDRLLLNCIPLWNQGCKNCPESLGPVSPFDLPDDYEDGVNIGVAHWCVGSLIVNPGCTFYGFSDRDFEGEVYEYGPGKLDKVSIIRFSQENGVMHPRC